MRKENSASSLPAAVAALGQPWGDLWLSLPPLVSYREICGAFHFANNKSASNVLTGDPNAPVAVRVGRAALFDRTALILWAFNRSRNARRRGCQAHRGNNHA